MSVFHPFASPISSRHSNLLCSNVSEMTCQGLGRLLSATLHLWSLHWIDTHISSFPNSVHSLLFKSSQWWFLPIPFIGGSAFRPIPLSLSPSIPLLPRPQLLHVRLVNVKIIISNNPLCFENASPVNSS